MLNEFLTNGHYKINDVVPLNFIDIYRVKWYDACHMGLQLAIKDNKLIGQLKRVQEYLSDTYVKQIDPNYKSVDKIDLVNGMDDATLVWHNDLVEGPNLCILVYFDTMDKDIGGAIQFRNTQTKELINSYYPQQHDIIIMNQSLKFEHIVTPLNFKLPRRVASFNYYINESLTQ